MNNADGPTAQADVHVVFSGDLGAPHSPLLKAPRSPYRADVLVLESTYGDRLHEGRRHPLSFEQLTTIDSHADHENTVSYLRKSARPCVVIAAGGMCSGGRIVNYLKALIGDPRTDVLFVGYQAAGTPGRDIQQYGPRGGWVRLDGQKYDIRARIYTNGGYSAHADQRNLLNFVHRMRHPPGEVRLVHGDSEAKEALRKKLRIAGNP